MNGILYCIWQCTWGILQTLMGAVIFLINIWNKHYSFHGAVVTEWGLETGLSMGLFIFVPKSADEKVTRRMLLHEYGHTVQSLILGPLYPFLINVPSALWCFLPCFKKRRKRENISYYSFITERWADALAEKIKEKQR